MSNKELKESKETIDQSNGAKSTSKQTSKTKSGTNTPTESKTSKTTSKKAQNTSSKKTTSKVTDINSKPKKLTLAAINRESSKFNKRKKVYVCDGQYEVLIDEHFRRTSIQNVSANYLIALQTLQGMEGIDQQAIMGASNLIYTLIMKEFSNLPIPEIDEIDKLIKVSNNLIDLGITEELFNGGKNSFKQSEIDLVNKQINKALENVDKILGEMGLVSEIEKMSKDRVDVDDYFTELDARGYEITEDEDLDLLIKVINQLESDGIYDEYMEKLDSNEIEMLNERMKLIAERKIESGEDSE